MREMVFRERQERVAHMDAISKMIARMFNMDADKMFSGILADYAFEVFQESYDADQLRRRAEARRAAQQRIRARREHDQAMMRKLEGLETAGKEFDKEVAKEVVKPQTTKLPTRSNRPGNAKKTK